MIIFLGLATMLQKLKSLTEYPSIFGGKIQNSVPDVGGILFGRDNDDDIHEKEKFNIPSIDLVIVDLYPFKKTVQEGGSEIDIIEKIDIGGISLIRAAAKILNVLCISSKNDC